MKLPNGFIQQFEVTVIVRVYGDEDSSKVDEKYIYKNTIARLEEIADRLQYHVANVEEDKF